MPASKIKKDDAVFLHDGDVAIGAVRQVSPSGKPGIVVYIENAGDFLIPFSAVQDVHFGKVILDGNRLDAGLKTAINRAHTSEDPDNSQTHDPA